MGKREITKEQYRKRIIDAAREVFSSRGFEHTTIALIAEKAGIGLGTAYNYFTSKEELFILAMAEDMAETSDADLEVRDSASATADEIVIGQIMRHIDKMNWVNKKIWKIAFPVILGSINSKTLPIQTVLRADFKMMSKIEQLINQLKNDNMLPAHFNTPVAIDLIFGALFFQLTMYIYMDETTFEQTRERIRTDVKCVFNGLAERA